MQATHLPPMTPEHDETPKAFACRVRAAIADSMRDPPVIMSDLTNTDILEYYEKVISAKESPRQFVTRDDVARFSGAELPLMVPTALARRRAGKIAPTSA